MTVIDILQLAAVLLAAGLSSGLATGPRPWAIAAWIAPLPALLALQVAPAALAIPGIGLALFAGAAWRNRAVLPLPTPALLVTLAVSSVFGLLPFIAHRFLAPELPAVLASLVFPASLVLIEHSSSRSNPFGTWGALAYSQRRNLPLLQSASVTGLWGITFLVVWPATALATAIERGIDRSDTRIGLAVAVGTVAAAHLSGGRRLRRAHGTADGRTVTVAAVSRPTGLAPPETFQRLLTTDPSDPTRATEARTTYEALHDHLLDATAEAAAAGARLVVWPEADAPTSATDATALLDRIRETAKRHDLHILAGLVTIDQRQQRPLDNHVILIDPAGDVRARYRKAKLVPGFEAELAEPGDTPIPVVDTTLGRIAAAVCFDLDFPEHLRPAGQQHADLLLAAASDWPAIDRLHADMAAFRAIENGAVVVRAARWGRSEVVDPYGRTLAAADHVTRSGETLLTTVPVGDTRTSHHRYGSVVPIACALVLFAALANGASSVLTG